MKEKECTASDEYNGIIENNDNDNAGPVIVKGRLRWIDNPIFTEIRQERSKVALKFVASHLLGFSAVVAFADGVVSWIGESILLNCWLLRCIH